MTSEAFNTWTEDDPDGELTVTNGRITGVDLGWRANIYGVYKDFGAGKWVGVFTFYFNFYMSAHDSIEGIDQMMYIGQTTDTWADDNDIVIWGLDPTGVGDYSLQVSSLSENFSDRSIDLNFNTLYYIKLVCADSGVNNHSVITMYIYDNSARTSVVDTLSFDFNDIFTYRSIFFAYYDNLVADGDGSYFIENLDVGELRAVLQTGKYLSEI